MNIIDLSKLKEILDSIPKNLSNKKNIKYDFNRVTELNKFSITQTGDADYELINSNINLDIKGTSSINLEVKEKFKTPATIIVDYEKFSGGNNYTLEFIIINKNSSGDSGIKTIIQSNSINVESFDGTYSERLTAYNNQTGFALSGNGINIANGSKIFVELTIDYDSLSIFVYGFATSVKHNIANYRYKIPKANIDYNFQINAKSISSAAPLTIPIDSINIIEGSSLSVSFNDLLDRLQILDKFDFTLNKLNTMLISINSQVFSVISRLGNTNNGLPGEDFETNSTGIISLLKGIYKGILDLNSIGDGTDNGNSNNDLSSVSNPLNTLVDRLNILDFKTFFTTNKDNFDARVNQIIAAINSAAANVNNVVAKINALKSDWTFHVEAIGKTIDDTATDTNRNENFSLVSLARGLFFNLSDLLKLLGSATNSTKDTIFGLLKSSSWTCVSIDNSYANYNSTNNKVIIDVPTNTQWQLLNFHITYTSDATVGIRLLKFTIKDSNTNVYYEAVSLIPQPDNNTYYYSFAVGLPALSNIVDADKVVYSLPPLVIPENFIIEITDKNNVSTADILEVKALVAQQG